MQNIRVIVAAHKEAPMPQDPVYLPVWVGSAISDKKLSYQRDDDGDNISDKNPLYCELTGLYWAWKNLDASHVGLVHYRRFFKGSNKEAISGDELDKILTAYKIIVPKKRRYYIESLKSHYIHTHQAQEFDEMRNVISEKCPEYLPAFDKSMNRTWGYMFNMMIMPKDMLSDYCEWVFSVIDQVVENIGTGDRSAFEKRYPGRLSELLFNCWIEYKLSAGELKKSDISEVPLLNLGDEKLFKKGVAFLNAKFFGKKQEGSF